MASSITLYPNFTTIGVLVEWALSDDSDRSMTTVALEWRKAAGTWADGFDAVVVANEKAVGSINFLLDNGIAAGDSVEVRATFSDSGDTLDATTVSDTATMRSVPVEASSVRDRYVDPAGSGSAYTDGSPGTLAGAISSAAAGDHIICKAGTYYVGGLNLTVSGTSADPIVIKPDEGASVILSGLDSASYTWTNAGAFGQPTAQNMYRATVSAYADTAQVYIDGNRLLPSKSLTDCKNFNRYGDVNFNSFYHDGSTLYVHMTDGSDPDDATTVEISKQKYGIKITGDYVIVDGITVEHYGRDSGARGIVVDNAEDITIKSCTMRHNNHASVWVIGACHRLTIYNNDFSDAFDNLNWNAIKSTGYRARFDSLEKASTVHIGNQAPVAQQVVIDGNTFHDLFDGLSMSPNQGNIDDGIGAWDVCNNTIRDCVDDGMELDEYACCVRIFNNTVYNATNIFSMARAHTGPIYVAYNTAWLIGNDDAALQNNTSAGFKFNAKKSANIGRLYLIHNTFHGDYSKSGTGLCHVARAGTNATNDPYYDGVYMRNNVMVGNDSALWLSRTAGWSDLDYNCYLANSSTVMRWGGTSYGSDDIASFRTASSQETNGFFDNPLFASVSNRDYRLQSGSPCYETGIAIDGFNDHIATPSIGSKQTAGGGAPGGGPGGTRTTYSWDSTHVSGNYLEINASNLFARLSAWSWCGFAYWNGGTSDQGIVFVMERSAGTAQRIYARISNTASPTDLVIRANGADRVTLTSAVTSATWYAIVVTNDGLGNADSLNAYIYTTAGSQVDTGSGTMGTNDTVPADSHYLGARLGSPTNDEIDGEIALPMYVTRELSAADIVEWVANPFDKADEWNSVGDVTYFFDFDGTSPQTSEYGSNTITENGSMTANSAALSFDTGTSLPAIMTVVTGSLKIGVQTAL